MFVGRRDERARFAALLSEMPTTRTRWHRRRKPPQDPSEASRVVLVHGLGRSGKSELLRHFREMAQESIRTIWLDWEDEQRDQPSRGDSRGARERFARVNGRVTWFPPFHTKEIEAIALCGLGETDRAEQHLRDAAHLWAPGDRFEPRAVYDLLSDPPLPGIDRLRSIVDKLSAG